MASQVLNAESATKVSKAAIPPVEDSGRGNKTELFSFSAGNYCQDQMLRGKAGLLKESFSVKVQAFFLKGEFFCYRRVSNITAVKICSENCL